MNGSGVRVAGFLEPWLKVNPVSSPLTHHISYPALTAAKPRLRNHRASLSNRLTRNSTCYCTVQGKETCYTVMYRARTCAAARMRCVGRGVSKMY